MGKTGQGPHLALFGRISFVSRKGLAEVLKKVRDEGLPANTNASSIGRAKADLAHIETPFGPLLQTVSIRAASEAPAHPPPPQPLLLPPLPSQSHKK